MQKHLQTSLPVEIFSPTLLNSDLMLKDYIIYNGRLIWVNPKIYLQQTTIQQYIDTLYNIKANTDISLNFTYTVGMFPLGVEGTLSSTDRYVLSGSATAPGGIYAAIWKEIGSGTKVWEEEDTKINLSIQSNKLYINNILKYTGGTPQDINQPLYLFAQNNKGIIHYAPNGINSKIYSLDIYESGVLVRSFRPVPQGLVINNFTCPSNGLFDLIQQQFYANQGVGSFSYGKDS